MYKNLLAPLTIQVEITEACMNRCIHCYNYWRHLAGTEVTAVAMDPAQVDTIMDEIEGSRVFEIVITGGEPLLNKPVMYRMLDRVDTGGFLHASLNTSLLGLTETDARRLGGYTRLVSILTSVMGPTAEIHDQIANHEGSFQKTIAGIKLLRRFGIPVSANMVVSRLNMRYISQTAALCKRLGIKMFNATRAVAPLNCPDFRPYSLDLQEFRAYLSDLGAAGRAHDLPVGVLTVYPFCGVGDVCAHPMTAGRRCSAGVSVAAVSATGEFRACTHVQESVGNILSETLPALWARLAPWRNASLVPTICKDCRALALCGGGCRASAQVVNGTLNAADPLMCEEGVEVAIAKQMLFRETKARYVVDIPERLRLNPELRWRNEPFGSVWFLNRCVGIFNADTTELLVGLSGATFDAQSLAQKVPREFLCGLVEKRILIAGECRVSASGVLRAG